MIPALAVAAAWAAAGAPPATGGGAATEQQRVAEIQAAFAAGDYDKAADAAENYLRMAKDQGTKTEATKVLAESTRKKGDWRAAPAAYDRLRDQFPKNSDNWVRYDAISEVLKGSPMGVYRPTGSVSPKAGADGAALATVADDKVLAEAVARLVTVRVARLKSRAATLARATTPQAVLATYQPMAEEARQLAVLAPDAPPDVGRELGSAAGAQLGRLGAQILAALQAKLDKYQPKMKAPWNLSNADRKDIQDTSANCRQMAESERQFQAEIARVRGKGDWADADRLRGESSARETQYSNLAQRYVVPPYTTIRTY
jgi:tetratricopeptide (TPR) repeat protein